MTDAPADIVAEDLVPALPLTIEPIARPVVNFAAHQRSLPIVDSIRLTNTGEQPLLGISVMVRIATDAADPVALRVDRIEPGQSYTLDRVPLTIAGDRLAAQTERERTTLSVTVEADGFTPAKWSQDLDILAANEWGGTQAPPELLASFVLPNHPALEPVLVRAAELLAEDSSPGLDGYQSGDPKRARRIAEAGYVALLERGINYINPPASFETAGQRVRLADHVIGSRLGTCLDLALLLCAVWEQSGLHPVIVLFDTHAIAGVWLKQEHFSEPVIDSGLPARKRAELDEMILVESTLLTHGEEARFDRACDKGFHRLAGETGPAQIIDIRSARKRGLRPLPVRAERTEIAPGEERRYRLSTEGESESPFVPPTPSAPVRTIEPLPSSPSEPEDRVSRWKRRLLDLSLRNRLINFRQTRRTVPLMVGEAGLGSVEDALAGGAGLALLPRPKIVPDGEGTESRSAFLVGELSAGRIFADLSESETTRRGVELYRDARSSLEETGANLLHLALGTLVWYERGSSEPREAPLVLVPVRLERPGAGRPLVVRMGDESARTNAPLLEKLRLEFGIADPSLGELPEDESGIDLDAVLRKFREAVKTIDRWEVRESAVLGLFSFSRHLMWLDLEERSEDLRQSPLVRRLMDAGDREDDSEVEEVVVPEAEDLDAVLAPGQPLCTRDADSSQLEAVRAAGAGETFVLQGPPGTGKSQTIANIIADALGRGERVLFVAEKRAALTVVRGRLEQDGLGPFCLELHSNRASKREVYDQIREAVECVATREPAEWDATVRKLGETRGALNDYVSGLHEPRSSGESVRMVIDRLTELGEGPRAELKIGEVAAIDAATLTELRSVVGRLAEAAGVVEGPGRGVSTHSLRGVGIGQFSFGLPDEARQRIDHLRTRAATLRDEAATWLASIGVDGGPDVISRLSEKEAGWIIDLAEHLGACPGTTRELLTGPDWSIVKPELESWIGRGRVRDATRADLLTRYDSGVLSLELVALDVAAKRAAAKTGIPRWWAMRPVKKALQAVGLGKVDGSRLSADVAAARAVVEESSALATAAEPSRVFGRRWSGAVDRGGWDELAAMVAWADGLRVLLPAAGTAARAAAIGERVVDTACGADDANAPDASSLREAFNAFAAARDAVEQALEVDGADAWGDRAEGGYLPRLDAVAERWRGALAELSDWCHWRAVRADAHRAGLGGLVDLLETDASSAEIGSAFERSFGERWLLATADSIDAIRGFSGRGHEAIVRRFRELDERVIALTKDLVRARLAAGVPRPSGDVSRQSEMGIVLRELEKRRSHLPIRKLVERAPRTLARLKPCFLMSPLSVAQYLDPGLPPFDVVVFDEASQIPPWEAVGAIARGSRVIVVGDSKQLPPTSFFEKTEDEDEEAGTGEEELESILQECVASGVPSRRLRWHYRSRHESLIAFSNVHYYDGSLETFPSPVEAGGELGVSLRRVEGVYERGGSKTNRAEAEAIIEEMARVAREGRESVGVVTFNIAQQVLIQDLLDERCRKDPELEKALASGGGGDEPAFVKNLESVQGDERDVILFSITYGPDEHGRVSMNFGPLNRDGGERRLNVAVTRARRRVVVFTSMDAGAIDLGRTDRVGVRHLRRFLEYAERGAGVLGGIAQDLASVGGGAIERAVAARLRERGHEVEEGIGAGGYRIGLGVRDGDRFVLGIEFDGRGYAGTRAARDRDRLRASVLEDLGWTLARVWSVEWRLNPEGVLDALERAIAEAKRARHAVPQDDGADAEVVREEGAGIASSGTVAASEAVLVREPAPYRVWDGGVKGEREDLVEAGDDRAAVRVVREMVEVEGPVVDELVMRRLIAAYGVDRLTAKVRGRCEDILQKAIASGAVRRDGDALWPARGELVCEPRTGERSLDEIPLAERAAAVVWVLREQVSLPLDELVKEAAKVLGVARVTGRTAGVMEEGVDEAVRRGDASVDGRVVSLAE